jgi:aminocarboxymuconate-semialdehyde decarboxylase
MARLVFAGHFDRFPELKMITHHMGAMAPYFEGRIGPGWDQLGARTSDVDYSKVLQRLKKRPLDYFKMFYADTALFGAYDATVVRSEASSASITSSLHPTRPFDPEKGPMYIRDTIAIVDRLPIGEDERQRIYWRNAVELLRL